ncbi:helix-turn-helix domain-containing protein [Amycolatopsis japonica]|uniref:nSTAND1 domain-containing NTPase n=1 Tax=Amycolatopsis japonica TaxID=208439 RepID=UPI0033D2E083
MPRPERPLDGENTALTRFAADLRTLREAAGRPTYRQLSARAHYSTASLSEAAAGRKLPSLAVTLAFVDACGGDRAAWESRWSALAAELHTPSRMDAPDDAASPYAGLTCFEIEDVERFFGRDDEVTDLMKRLREQRFLGVFGASGAGKSSVLRAGLAARIREETPDRPVVVLTPGPHPIEECAVHLAKLTGGPVSAIRDELAAEPRNLHLRIRQTMAELGDEVELLLIVDQFEEVFSSCSDPGEREWFIEALLIAAGTSTSRTRVVLGVRADFFGHLGQYPRLVAALRDAQVLIGSMNADALREVVIRPAAAVNCTVETALVTRLVAEAAGHPGILPLLSHALRETWRHRGGMALTLAGYDRTGGIRYAISRTAEEVYTGLDPDRRTAARNLFLRLTATDDGVTDTRRRASLRELGDDAVTADVIDRLARARLLTVDKDSVELAHEALIRHWPRLRDWLTEDRDGLRVHRQLTTATDTWEALGKDESTLYRGMRLALALEWAERYETSMSPRERRFLQASKSIEIKCGRRLRQLVVVLSVLVLLAVTTTVFAVRAQQTATGQRNASQAQVVASQAIALYPTDPDLAVQLSLSAHRLAPTTHTREALLSTLPLAVISHPTEILSVAYSPDGRTLATANHDGSIRLWNLADPRKPVVVGVLTGHTSEIYSVTFSPDGRTLASGAFDRTVRLWNVAEVRRPLPAATLTGHTEAVKSVAFSPDGRTLASSSMDHHARLWDVADPARPTELGTLDADAEALFSAKFSGDGRTLATGGDDSTVRLWNVADPRNPTLSSTLTGHSQMVLAIAVSPDGHTLASAGDDQTVRLWDIAEPARPRPLATLTGHADGVYAVAFSSDGRTLASAGDDRTVRLWDVTDTRGPAGPVTLSSHTDAVESVAFSPDGRTLATASWDNTARLLDTNFAQAGARACEHVHGQITEEQWNRHFPDLDYAPPCTS